MNAKALFISAGVAGVAMALLSSIPIVSFGNCLLCGWIWGGGIFAVWFYRRMNNGQAATMGNAIVTGLLAGVVAAVIASLVSAVMGGSRAAIEQALVQVQSQQGVELPAGLVGLLTSGIFTFLLLIIIYPIFGLIGGAIGGSIWKPTPPPYQQPPYQQPPTTYGQ
jgi:hypothetical protein